MTTDDFTAAFNEAYCTSGTSPTASPTTLHLVGPGQVGQALLRQLPDTPLRLIGISDTSGTRHAKDGLDPLELAELKARHCRIRDLQGAESLPVDLAIDLVDADIVIDTTATDVTNPGRAVDRALRVLERGACIAFAAKDAIYAAGDQLLDPSIRSRVGINAVFGGTGHALRRELPFLQRETCEVALVGNASTTAVIEVVQCGGTIEDGIAQAQAAGILEPDPNLDLCGHDAATKLVAIARILWGRDISIDQVDCQDLRSLSADQLRRRYAEGITTRLVARARADGGLTATFEATPIGSALAVPGNRVAYSYRLQDGDLRVHVGHGIGPEHTAAALFFDLQDLRTQVRRVQS